MVHKYSEFPTYSIPVDYVCLAIFDGGDNSEYNRRCKRTLHKAVNQAFYTFNDPTEKHCLTIIVILFV